MISDLCMDFRFPTTDAWELAWAMAMDHGPMHGRSATSSTIRVSTTSATTYNMTRTRRQARILSVVELRNRRQLRGPEVRAIYGSCAHRRGRGRTPNCPKNTYKLQKYHVNTGHHGNKCNISKYPNRWPLPGHGISDLDSGLGHYINIKL